ncbi:MAG: hypothetical protein ACLTMR_00635 [Faecalibacillus sp.]
MKNKENYKRTYNLEEQFSLVGRDIYEKLIGIQKNNGVETAKIYHHLLSKDYP